MTASLFILEGLKRMSRRLLLFAALLVLSVSACRRPDRAAETAGTDAGKPAPGDWAVVRFEAEPDNLNALTSVTAVAHTALWGANNSQVYELLMAYNSEDWDVTVPLLAEAAPVVSQDHLTYTFTIRDGVKWHDGQPFTADDVLFTFKAAACPLTDAAPVRSYLTDIADIQVEGRTVRFVMSKPNVYNERNLNNVLAIIPKHVFDENGLLDGFTYRDMIGAKGKSDPMVKDFADRFNHHAANRAPIGTGPYKFEKWDTGREIVLTRNDQYWGKKPYLDKIVYRTITDYTAALTALKAGDIDIQPRLLPQQYKEQTGGAGFDEQFETKVYAIPNQFQITWNNERPFFKDKKVRQAMTMLVDRESIIKTIRFGLGELGDSIFHPKSRDYDRNLKPWPFDPKRAAALLDEADWKDHDGDGIRDNNGMKFKFEFVVSSSSAVQKQISAVLKEELRKAGIEMTERLMELALMTETMKEHRFDASAIGFSKDLVQDPFQGWHSSSTKGGSNYQNFKNAESDRLLEQARQEFDAEKRKRIYEQWQELIYDEQPVTFLYWQVEPAAYSKRFEGDEWLPLRPGYDLTSWWVPAARQKYKNGQ